MGGLGDGDVQVFVELVLIRRIPVTDSRGSESPGRTDKKHDASTSLAQCELISAQAIHCNIDLFVHMMEDRKSLLSIKVNSTLPPSPRDCDRFLLTSAEGKQICWHHMTRSA